MTLQGQLALPGVDAPTALRDTPAIVELLGHRRYGGFVTAPDPANQRMLKLEIRSGAHVTERRYGPENLHSLVLTSRHDALMLGLEFHASGPARSGAKVNAVSPRGMRSIPDWSREWAVLELADGHRLGGIVDSPAGSGVLSQLVKIVIDDGYSRAVHFYGPKAVRSIESASEEIAVSLAHAFHTSASGAAA